MSDPACVLCPQCRAATSRRDTLLACRPMESAEFGFYIRECWWCGCKFDFDTGRAGTILYKEVVLARRTVN